MCFIFQAFKLNIQIKCNYEFIIPMVKLWGIVFWQWIILDWYWVMVVPGFPISFEKGYE